MRKKKRISLFKPISLCSWEVLRLGQHISGLFTSLAINRMACDLAKSCRWPWQWPLLSWLQRLLFNALAYNHSFVYQVNGFFLNIYYYYFCKTYQRKRKQPCQGMIRGHCAVSRTSGFLLTSLHFSLHQDSPAPAPPLRKLNNKK